MANGIRIDRREDGRVDVIVEGLDATEGLDLVGRLMSRQEQALPIRPRKTPTTASQTAVASNRKKADPQPCRFCGQLVGPQGRVSHERTKHAAELAKEASRKNRKTA